MSGGGRPGLPPPSGSRHPVPPSPPRYSRSYAHPRPLPTAPASPTTPTSPPCDSLSLRRGFPIDPLSASRLTPLGRPAIDATLLIEDRCDTDPGPDLERPSRSSHGHLHRHGQGEAGETREAKKRSLSAYASAARCTLRNAILSEKQDRRLAQMGDCPFLDLEAKQQPRRRKR